MSQIIVNNLHKSFKGHEVLKGLTFTCENEIVFIAGRNGAGKTTFIRIALGMESCDKGDITYKNKQNDKMGVVFDTPCLYAQMTCRDNIKIFCGEYYNDKEYVRKIKDKLNLDHSLLKKRVDKCSFGQQHRLSVAIALIRKPKYLFLDEPTIGLDPISWGLIRESILLNKSEQKGCIIITGQDYFELGNLADKLLILDKGISQYYGSVADLLNKFPKRILLRTSGSILPDPLNLYCGKIEGDDDKVFHLIGDEQEILDKIKRLDVEIEYLSVKEMDLKEAILEVMNN
jgi:ABC-2 type transport system ATP-binding protein/Cu-processing system ATP-binding protein